MIGKRVKVKRNQRRLGGDKCPGREGVVVSENTCGRPRGLWDVKLDATKRATERTETFWTDELEELEAC